MRFYVEDKLTEEEIQSGLQAVVKDGLASQAMVTLTGGAFLIAFALKLGASNATIGLLAAIPPLTQLLQIPSIYLVEKIRNRRAITVYSAGLSRIFWLPIALIPFLFLSSPRTALAFFLTMIFFHSAIAAIPAVSWNSWMRDLIPQGKLGAFFAKRMALSTTLGIVLSLGAAFYIDKWVDIFPNYELYSYSILFFLGFLAGMSGLYFLSITPEPRMSLGKEKIKFATLILKPFKNVNFRNLITFSGAWSFAVSLAAPFFIVYMLKRLQMNMSFIIALLVLSQIMYLLFLKIWGKFTDRFSNKSVLNVSGPLFLLCIFAFTFTTLPDKYILTVPLLIIIHIFMGISTSGVNLASGNIGFKLAPRGEATTYLAARNLVNSIAAGIGPILGGKFADFFAGRELSLMLKWVSPGIELAFDTLNLQQWDFFFFFAFIIGFYSIHRLALVKEKGEVKGKVVVRELLFEIRKNMRNFSSVEGLRYMVQFPFSLMRGVKKIKKDE
jgi:MFS family permease